MTNPIAVAIAALEAIRNRSVVGSSNHTQAEYALEALLSAQGQAGKPVGWRVKIGDSDIWDFAESEEGANWQVTHSGPRGVVEPLYVQPQPAAGVTNALTTARTALEAAEKALANSLDVFSLLKEHAPDPAIVRPYIADLSVALRTVSSVLATIKGLET